MPTYCGRWQENAYWQFLTKQGDSVRLLEEAAKTGSAVQFRDIAAKVQAEGLLTRALLARFVQSKTYASGVQSAARRLQDKVEGAVPSLPGHVWVPTVNVGGSDPGLAAGDQAIAIAQHMTCIVTKGDAVNLTTPHTREWSKPGASLSALVSLLGTVVRGVCRDADPQWTAQHVQYHLTRDVTLVAQDRSHELAAALALVSAAFDLELPAGSAAIGMVEVGDGSGTVRTVGRDMTWIKVDGLVHSLPILSSIFVCADDAEFVRSVLPERSRVHVISVGSVRDLPKLLQVDPQSFRGLRRNTLWKRFRAKARTYFSLGVPRRDEIRDRLYDDRHGVRELVGVLAGELVAVPAFLAGSQIASTADADGRKVILAAVTATCVAAPWLLATLLIALGILGGKDAQKRFGERMVRLEEAGVRREKDKEGKVVPSTIDQPYLEMRGFLMQLTMEWCVCIVISSLAYAHRGEWTSLGFLGLFLIAQAVASNSVKHAPRVELDRPFLDGFGRAWRRVWFIFGLAILLPDTHGFLAIFATLITLVQLFSPLPRAGAPLAAPALATLLHVRLHARRVFYLAGVVGLVEILLERREVDRTLAPLSAELLARVDALDGVLVFIALALVVVFNLRRAWGFYSTQVGPSPDETRFFVDRFGTNRVGGYPVINLGASGPKRVRSQHPAPSRPVGP